LFVENPKKVKILKNGFLEGYPQYKEEFWHPEEAIVLCYTNKACDVLKSRGVDANRVFTFDSYFYEKENIPKAIKNIFVDEFSMMPTSWLRRI